MILLWKYCLFFLLFLKFFFFFFNVGHFFKKSLLNLSQCCFCFMFWFFWLQVTWDLSSVTRDWTCTPCIGGKSLVLFFLKTVFKLVDFLYLKWSLGCSPCSFLDCEHCCYYEELITIVDVADYIEFFSPFLVVPNLLRDVDAHWAARCSWPLSVSLSLVSVVPASICFRQRWLWIEDG